MSSDMRFFIELAVSFLPFVLFTFLNGKANIKKEKRCRQYPMPVVAVIYSVVLLIFLSQLSALFTEVFLKIADFFEGINVYAIADFIRNLYMNWGIYLELVLFNTGALLLYITLKRILTLIFSRFKVKRNSLIGSVVELFYSYDEQENNWFIKEHYGQACTFIKTIYYGSCFVSGLALLISCWLCTNNLVSAPFYPVFAVIIIGEMAFFVDGLSVDTHKSELSVQAVCRR